MTTTKKNQYGDSMDMEYDWYTKDEFLEMLYDLFIRR